MFKKIAAIIATATMLVVGFSAMPASATNASNAGAVTKQSWSLSEETPEGEVQTSTSNTLNVPDGAGEWRFYTNTTFGQDLAKSLAGHVIRVEWNKVFPSGVEWHNGQYNSQGVSPVLSGFGTFGYYPGYEELNQVLRSTDANDPANSSLFTVPPSVQNATGQQTFTMTVGLEVQSWGENEVVPGSYTMVPTFYDKTAGAPLTFSTTAGSGNLYVHSKHSYMTGEGEFNGNIPARGYFNQNLLTCVNREDLVAGNTITAERYVDGIASTEDYYYQSFQAKGSNNYIGSLNPNYTVQPADATDGSGFRFSLNVTVDNMAGNTEVGWPNTDLIIRDLTSGEQLESSCAAETPLKPTFTLNSLYQATATWSKISTDVATDQWSRPISYNYSIYKASDLTIPVNTGYFNYPTESGNTFSKTFNIEGPGGMSVSLDLSTDYVIRITARNQYDGVSSAESPASDPSRVSPPAAPSAPTFTLPNLRSATIGWNKVAGDEPSQYGFGRTVNYYYAIYKESAPTVPVVTGFFNNPTLNGERYSETVQFPMGGAPSYMPINLDANTNYIAKVKSGNNNGESEYSAASAAFQIAGPATPNAPVIASITVSTITATLTVRANETSLMYSAKAYDQAFPDIVVGEGSCSAATPGSTSYTCRINSTGSGFNAPNMYVVKAIARNMEGLSSLPSAASNSMMGSVPGVTIATPSGGTTAGDAKTLTSTFPEITDVFGSSFGGMMNPPKASIISDGRGNIFTFSEAADQSLVGIGKRYDLKKLKADFTGTDATFGTGGKVSTTLNFGQNSNTIYLPNVWTFANASKVVILANIENRNENNQNMGSTVLLQEATLGEAFGTPIDMGAKPTEFCVDNVDPSLQQDVYGYLNMVTGFQGLSRPAVQVSCSQWDSMTYTSKTERFVATVGTDGTLTKVFKQNSYNANQTNLNSSSFSYNPSASAPSDIAAVGYVLRSKSSGGATSNYERVLVRVKVDGTATETPVSQLSQSSSEPSVSMAPVNDGTTVYAIVKEIGVNKLASVSVASGSFSTPTTMAITDSPMMGSVGLAFPSTGAPVVNGKIAFTRTDTTMAGIAIAPMSYNIATGAVVTGESLAYSVSGSPVNFSVIDTAGHLNFVYTPAVTRTPLVHSVIQWKNVRDMVAVPTPAVTMPKVTFSLNAGGTSITIEGVNFSETSAAKKVTGIRFGSDLTKGLVTTMTKTATSITVKIPTSTVAGMAVAPTPATAYTAPISVVLGGGSSLAAGSVTYIGTAKLAQSVTLTVNTALANTAEADRVISTQLGALVPSLAAVPGAAVLSTSNAAICAIVDGKVRFLSNGNCVVKATKAGNDWLAEGSATATIPVLKADSVTAGFAEGEVPSEVLEEDEAIAPVIKLASGRTDYTMTPADTTKCSINALTKMIWFKQGNQNCVITIATAAANSTWAAVSYDWTIAIQPPAGGAGSPLLVRNDNVMAKLPGLALKWNQKTNQVYFVTRVKWIGPVQAKMTFTDLAGNPQSCVVNFGTLKKTPLPKNGDPFILTSPALCTDTKSVLNKTNTAAEKLAQTNAYNAFKALVAANTAAGESTPVEFTYRRELHRATDYALRNPGETLLTKEWSTPTYARLYYKAIDSITAALPKGVVAAATPTADGAFNPVITLESKRTDYTVTSADDTKCAVLPDGRIWAKVAGENCSLSIGTGANNVWAGKTYTWTFPMVAGVAADLASAILAPSNNTAVYAGPITITWDQAKYAVAMKLTNRNVGLVTAKMTFNGLDNQQYTCEVKFGSASKVSAALALAYKTQSSGAFCSATGLSPALKATQAIALAKFKALVAARKSGVGVGVIPVTFAFKYEAHSPVNGALIQGETLNSDPNKPWSQNIHVKLNFRASAF